jgi:hypothetical protein
MGNRAIVPIAGDYLPPSEMSRGLSPRDYLCRPRRSTGRTVACGDLERAGIEHLAYIMLKERWHKLAPQALSFDIATIR